VGQRRDKGSGSITYDTNADRWVARLNLGITPAGKRVRVKATAATRAEARRKLEQLRDKHLAGVDLTQRHQTICELVELWLARGLPTTTSPGTRANYATVLGTHVQPALGEARADELTVEHVEALLDAMAERGDAASTIRLTLSLLKRVLTFGQRRGVVVRNVADLAQPPAAPTKPRDGLTVEQARRLLQACRGERYGPLITLSLLLGLRPGEATGLTWPHVHLDTDPPTLTVDHSLRRLPDGTLTLASPKTASSRRTLALPQPGITALHDQQALQDKDRQAAGRDWSNPLLLVFTTDTGGPLDPSNVRRALTRIAQTAGIGHVHPHQLRHATASLLSDAGVPLEDIADTLGHRSVTITADIYRHPLQSVRTRHVHAMTALATPQ
jgi:integrase